jgi:hypothetical protein
MLRQDSSLMLICGTKCGKCVEWIEQGCFPGTDKKFNLNKEEI